MSVANPMFRTELRAPSGAPSGSHGFQPVVVILLALVAACGGSGGSSSDGPTAPQPMLVFTPDNSPSSPSISMRSGSGTTTTVLALDIQATDVVDVQTVDFTLDYPANLLDFMGFRQGSFLGTDASVVLDQVGSGSFTALITTAAAGGATGGGIIVTFEFQAIAGGNGRIDFVAPEATDRFGDEIEEMSWISGTVQIVR